MVMTIKKWWWLQLVSCLLVVGSVVLAAHFGSQPIALGDMLPKHVSFQHDLFYSIRLPRILLGLVVGCALGGSGAALQGLLRNPLADPYILGLASGAALGYVVALTLGAPFGLLPVFAFGASLASMAIIYRLALIRGRLVPHILLLSGVVFNAFAFALILVINLIFSAEQSHNILMLLIGTIGPESYSRIGWIAAIVIVSWIGLIMQGKGLNIVAQSGDAATTLGVDVDRLKMRIFFLTSLMVGAVVSVAGLIGFVGLFIPHMVRLMLGSDHRWVLPASGFLGAIALVLADTLARTILIQTDYMTELPVGAVTALVGGPFFLLLLFREKRRW